MVDQRLTLRLEFWNGQFVGELCASGTAVDRFTNRTQRGDRAWQRYYRTARRIEQANGASAPLPALHRRALRYFGEPTLMAGQEWLARAALAAGVGSSTAAKEL